MEKEAINKAIAGCLGRNYHKPTEAELASGSYHQYEPDFTSDLNAMHEAEKVFQGNQFHAVRYPHEVFKVVTGLEWKGDMGYFFPMVIHSTAAQRAEAFLKAIGKWVAP